MQAVKKSILRQSVGSSLLAALRLAVLFGALDALRRYEGAAAAAGRPAPRLAERERRELRESEGRYEIPNCPLFSPNNRDGDGACLSSASGRDDN